MSHHKVGYSRQSHNAKNSSYSDKAKGVESDSVSGRSTNETSDEKLATMKASRRKKWALL